MLASSCSQTKTENLTLSFDTNGNYMGFASISEIYTPEQAIKDGCYVSSNLELVGGEQSWEKFLQSATDGKDASIRIMSIYDDDNAVYYEDLYYIKGNYQIFDSSSEDLSEHTYKYLLDLRGRSLRR